MFKAFIFFFNALTTSVLKTLFYVETNTAVFHMLPVAICKVKPRNGNMNEEKFIIFSHVSKRAIISKGYLWSIKQNLLTLKTRDCVLRCIIFSSFDLSLNTAKWLSVTVPSEIYYLTLQAIQF